jgi:hypothetical protein
MPIDQNISTLPPLLQLAKDLWIVIFDYLNHQERNTLRLTHRGFRKMLPPPEIVADLFSLIKYSEDPLNSFYNLRARLKNLSSLCKSVRALAILVEGDQWDNRLVDVETLNLALNIGHVKFVQQIVNGNAGMKAMRVKALLPELFKQAADGDKQLVEPLILEWSHDEDVLLIETDMLERQEQVPINIFNASLGYRCSLVAETLSKRRSFENHPVQTLEMIQLIALIETESDSHKMAVWKRLLSLFKAKLTKRQTEIIVSDLEEIKAGRSDSGSVDASYALGFHMVYAPYLYEIYKEDIVEQLLEGCVIFKLNKKRIYKKLLEKVGKKRGEYTFYALLIGNVLSELSLPLKPDASLLKQKGYQLVSAVAGGHSEHIRLLIKDYPKLLQEKNIFYAIIKYCSQYARNSEYLDQGLQVFIEHLLETLPQHQWHPYILALLNAGVEYSGTVKYMLSKWDINNTPRGKREEVAQKLSQYVENMIRNKDFERVDDLMNHSAFSEEVKSDLSGLKESTLKRMISRMGVIPDVTQLHTIKAYLSNIQDVIQWSGSFDWKSPDCDVPFRALIHNVDWPRCFTECIPAVLRDETVGVFEKDQIQSRVMSIFQEAFNQALVTVNTLSGMLNAFQGFSADYNYFKIYVMMLNEWTGATLPCPGNSAGKRYDRYWKNIIAAITQGIRSRQTESVESISSISSYDFYTRLICELFYFHKYPYLTGYISPERRRKDLHGILLVIIDAIYKELKEHHDGNALKFSIDDESTLDSFLDQKNRITALLDAKNDQVISVRCGIDELEFKDWEVLILRANGLLTSIGSAALTQTRKGGFFKRESLESTAARAQIAEVDNQERVDTSLPRMRLSA